MMQNRFNILQLTMKHNGGREAPSVLLAVRGCVVCTSLHGRICSSNAALQVAGNSRGRGKGGVCLINVFRCGHTDNFCGDHVFDPSRTKNVMFMMDDSEFEGIL
jgi:hypothetical protein